MGGQWYDALIAIPGCDKNMPGCLMAMGRLNRPSIMVYGGTIRAGCSDKFPQVTTWRQCVEIELQSDFNSMNITDS
jgi:dihydroxyacid dehydratase/phosphogluconate dehydratase